MMARSSRPKMMARSSGPKPLDPVHGSDPAYPAQHIGPAYLASISIIQPIKPDPVTRPAHRASIPDPVYPVQPTWTVDQAREPGPANQASLPGQPTGTMRELYANLFFFSSRNFEYSLFLISLLRGLTIFFSFLHNSSF